MKKSYVGIGSIILIASVVFIFYSLEIGPFDGPAHKSVEQVAPITIEKTDEKKSVTAMEALRLGYEEAKRHTEEEPLLINLTSTDNSPVPQQRTDGVDGKRDTWNLRFGSKNGNFLAAITIHDGKAVTENVKTDNNNLLRKGLYAVSDVKIDSPEAVKQAIEVLGMLPGNPEIQDDWIKGYHFTISGYLTDPNSFETRLLLRVLGISPNSPNSENESLRMNVFFDAKTGEMLNASEMTGYDKEGHSMWSDVDIKH